MDNSFMVVKRAIEDDGLRKDFSKRGRVPPKKIPGEVAGSFLGPLSIRMTRRNKDRVPSLPNHKHGPEEASISHPAPRSLKAPLAYLEGNK